MKRIIITFSLGLLLLACMRIEENADSIQETELTITAYRESEDITKTVRQTDGSVFWSPGDAVSLFFIQGENGGSRFVAQNTTASALAEFKGTITGFAGSGETAGGEFWFWGVYPYSEENSCDGTSITTVLPAVQTAKAGTFDDGLFITMAREKGLELRFFNLCGGFKFTVSREDVKTVKFHGNADENIAGKVKANWDAEGHPEIKEYVEGKKEITLNAPKGGTFVPGVEYYIIFFPELLSEGFTMTFLTSGGKQGDFMYSSSRQFRRGIFIGANNVDTKVTTWTDAEAPTEEPSGGTEGGTESGLYLGINYFGSDLSPFPIQLLSEESIIDFNSFIDARTTLEDQTLLYYSVDKSMARLQSNRFPNDLFSVAIVTFTDGQDDGSVGKKEDETGNIYYTGDYEKELGKLLENKVQGLSVMSYAIGLKQANGYISEAKFDKGLMTIAHPSENFAKVYDMAEVNAKFKSIAQELSNTIRLQKLFCTIPRQASGTIIRFTYDNITAATQSSLYIEGVYNSRDYTLQNVHYEGFSSSSGDIVAGVRTEKNEVKFSFEDIHRDDNEAVTMDYYKRWIYDEEFKEWNLYDETNIHEDENGIDRIVKSAAIILNLDCTESLGMTNFELLKQYAKGFINTLYTSSIDPEAVQKVLLDKSGVEMVIGESVKLRARVIPSTAIEQTITWTSSNPDVVSVDNEGTIVAKGVGSAIVTVTSKDGGKTASCDVTVIASRPVQSVSLNVPSTHTLTIGNSLQLMATVLPSNATDKRVEWTSSDNDIVTVSSSGVICGVQLGTATITATSVDGSSCSASCIISVMLPTNPTSLSLAVVDNNTGSKYYVSQSLYQTVDLSGYTQRGIVCGNATGAFFVLKLHDVSVRYHISGSHGLYNEVYEFNGSTANSGSRILPNLSEAEWLSNNMAAVNAAISSFAGTVMLTTTDYWTNKYRGDRYYYYFRSGTAPTLDSTGEKTCRVREVESL